jgi:oligosaccharide repeat unit polymerase
MTSITSSSGYKHGVKLIVISFLSITIGLISSFLDYASFIIGFTTLTAISFIYAEFRKERVILTLGSGFTIYWYFYTTSFWLNYKLGYNQDVDLNNYFILTLLSIIGFFFFQFIYFPGKSYEINIENLKTTIYNKKLLKISLGIIFIVAITMEIIFFSKVGISNFIFISRSERSLLLKNLGITYFTDLFFLVMIISYILNQLVPSRFLRFIFITSLINNTLYQLIIIDRSGLLEVVFPCIYLFLVFKKVQSRYIIFIGVILFLFLSYFKTIMSNIVFRGSSNLEPFKFNGEFEAWYHVGANILSNLEGGLTNYIYGRSYLTALYNLIVPFTNSEPLSIWYVRTYFYDIYIRGGGMAFSSIGEAILNFGYFGVPIYFMLLGFLCRWMKQYKHKDIKYLAIYAFIFTVLYKFFRSEFYSLTKTSWWFFILPLLFIFFAAKYVQRKPVK